MPAAESYLKPEVINQIKRLDLRVQFVVRGFLHGLHASPYQGFSVEFSEHRKYTTGDDPSDIDWLVYAKTDKYYGGDEYHRLPGDGPEPLDGLHAPAGTQQV